jgi:ABC-type phosphate transport system substrate-binding protein
MIQRTILALLVVIAATSSVAGAGEKYVVIVNESNPTKSMSKKDLSRLFLKQTLVWAHGEKALPVDLDIQASTRAQFTSEVHGRAVAAVQGYWNLKVFSGAVVPPAQKTTDSQVIQFVSTNPGAVGYVSRSAALQGVKVLQIAD